ncbi:hypothetical protein H4R19_002155 [Coemansia spiralis]|nr:hypothetical protein H4R19_002155 [Coemansia spiralis]
MAITSYIAGVILIAAWMWMCARRRHVFIGAFKLHPKTNLVVESLFVASHICIVISDRTFVNILPAVSAITFAEFVYPLSMAVVVILGLIFLYLLCKLFVAFGGSDEVQA